MIIETFKPLNTLLLLSLFAAAALHASERPSMVGSSKPNILLVMSDDMGFSDLGSYGSEIDTPVLDSLAADGLRFSNFYNAGRCWPTRTSLMTGYHLEQVTGGPPWQGKEKQPAVTARLTGLPELLRTQGYRSYHTGKWHVHSFPKVLKDAGFDHSLAFHNGENHFRPRHRTKDDVPYKNEDVHVSDAIADHMIGYLKDHQANYADAPFFSYLAFYAPHWPLHAHQATIDKYKGVYDAGWDELRQKRLERMQELGFSQQWAVPALEPKLKAPGIQKDAEGNLIFGPNEIYSPADWDSLSQETQDFQSLKMQIHAAMIDEMDQALGRVIDQIKAMGVFENTLILFLSDNGASAEVYGAYNPKHVKHDQNARMGGPDTHLCLGPGFADLANTPFRRYKTFTHEGGVATPLVAHWPAGIDSSLNGCISGRVGHAVDLVTTILDVAGIQNPQLQDGAPELPGRSFAAVFRESSFSEAGEELVYFSHGGNRGLRLGDWKVVSSRVDQNQWALYNLREDRAESNDLAAQYPEKLKALTKRWTQLDQKYKEQSRVEVLLPEKPALTSAQIEAGILYLEDFEIWPVADGSFTTGDLGSLQLSGARGANLMNPSGQGDRVLNSVNRVLGEKFGVIHSGASLSVDLEATVAANTTYLLSFDQFRRDDITGGRIRAEIQTANGKTLASQEFSAVEGKGVVKSRTLTWNSTNSNAGGRAMRLRFSDPDGGGVGQQAAIDNIQLSLAQ